MLDTPPGVKHIRAMLSIYTQERPTRLPADEAFFCVRGGRLVVRTPGVHPGTVSSNLSPRRVHEALDRQTTPAMAIGIADHAWSIGQLLDAALAVEPPAPTTTAPDRRRGFRVIEGGKC
jgi:hypothetical protein